MDTNEAKLSGIFVPVVTPFRDDEIQTNDLRFNLRELKQTRLRGYLALGSNGEFMSLSDLEQAHILELFAEEKGNKVLMAGTASESTKRTIEKSRQAAEMGFDYVSILTPHYFAKQMDGPLLQAYYKKIADNVSIPLLLYNAPGFTGGVQIPPQTVKALSRHPNIMGMKDSSPVGPARYLSVLDPDVEFFVLAGSVNSLYPSLHLGAVGGIVSLANVMPNVCCELYELFQGKKHDEAKELHFRLARLNEAVSGSYGVAGVKAAMSVTGFKGGEPRHPLRSLSDVETKRIRERILSENLGPL